MTQIDERWMREWVEFGIADLERYLGNHARFEVYCNSRTTQQIKNLRTTK